MKAGETHGSRTVLYCSVNSASLRLIFYYFNDDSSDSGCNFCCDFLSQKYMCVIDFYGKHKTIWHKLYTPSSLFIIIYVIIN